MLFSSAVSSIKAPLARHYAFSTRPVNIKNIKTPYLICKKNIRDKIKKIRKGMKNYTFRREPP